MANVCSKCSTENADGVLVCRQCGASLATQASWSRSLIPDDDNFDPLSAPTLVMQHTAPGVLPPLSEILIPPEPEPSRFGPKLLLGLVAFGLLLAGGVWLMRPTGEKPAPAPAPRPAVTAASVPALAASEAAAPPAPAAAASMAAAVPALAASHATAAPAPAVASVVAPAASAVDRRKRIPEPVLRRPAANAPENTPVVEPAPVVAAPPPPAPAPEPAKPKSVTDLCSAASLLTRGFCEHRECGKPEHAGDAVCVRLKEAEEARRFRQ